MKKLNVLLLLVFGVTLIMLLSCQKESFKSKDRIDNQRPLSFIEGINNYRPEADKIASLYHGFQNRIYAKRENTLNSLKGDPVFPDTTIDVGIWLIETGLNNEYGFKNDSIVYERQTDRMYNLDIADYGKNNLPVVPGEELLSVFVDMEHYIEEGALVDSLFWMCVVNLESIRDNDLTISIEPYIGRVLHLNGVLPPGTDPVPFPSGTEMTSCLPWDYGTHPLWQQIESRISGGPCFVFQPDYLIVFVGLEDDSWYIDLTHHDDSFWSGNSGSEWVYTEDCNYYLYAQKDIVDNNNPHLIYPNLFIGTFQMSYVHSDNPVQGKTWWHYSICLIYEKVFIGPGITN